MNQKKILIKSKSYNRTHSVQKAKIKKSQKGGSING